ncbi:pyridine nucleotide-disulfide oxidoreductase [Streptomyces sp. 3211.6]|uniref:NAD(P)-binding domain-containing protein n=1 Tax=Streptomyces TaxID=1883 RepID=UPI000CB36EC0|nr:MULTISPECIES: NAD(P)-binding domain-containing protein [Streptomyces]RKT08296.1 pyridine nucleotide-disulfide oxidoreductase [Streptomyces sp. 3211.6]RPF29696.1 pyridine nucleotide-disulfide oxidoreductase [Streptomyces sp. Ag109_G2-6]
MTPEILDCLIVGAGPGGLQVAACLREEGLTYEIVEQGGIPGSFFTTYPRHRQLISSNKRYTGNDDPEFNLRMDWNSLLSDDPDLRFTRYSERYFPAADDMVRYLADFASARELNITYNRRVVSISRSAGVFAAVDDFGDTRRARRVVISTGVSLPNIPDIPGIELAEQYATVSVDPNDFINQRVLVLGKGNSALETADNLIETAAVIHIAGPNPVKLAWKTHFVGHVRAVNNNFLDTYQLKSQNAVIDAELVELNKDAAGYRATFKFTRATVEHTYDRVIVCTGFRFDSAIFAEDCRPRLAIDGRFPELTGTYESSNVSGLYFAGTLTQQIDFKKSTSGFIHGFRYGARALGRVLAHRHHDRPWPRRRVGRSAQELTAAVIGRINRSSGLFQQFGVLADVLVLPPDGPARYYEEVPAPYLADGMVDEERDDAFSITLEFGPDHDTVDPFVPRLSSSVLGREHIDTFLHPVVRHYRRGEVVGTVHLPDDLENRWDRPDVHVEPLAEFFAHAVSG